jgi:Zn-dependent M28 family amino/carboxypeptidase
MKYLHLISLIFLLAACSGEKSADQPSDPLISRETLARHIEVLASDEFEGRAPSTDGEVKTINYLKSEFEALGVKPGNGDSYFQEVPLVKVISHPQGDITVNVDGTSETLAYQEDIMLWTPLTDPTVALENSEIVFVGYGIVAPEYDWNDYEGLDVEGKTVLILVNDPGYATQDANLFTGNAMTYYGRWTYKYEEAARQGAAGALVIHETGPAGYGWEVVSGGSSAVQMDVKKEGEVPELKMEGWITYEKVNEWMTSKGSSLEEMMSEALKEEFSPVSLGGGLNITFATEVEESLSNNVIAVIPGSERPDEYVFYMAHWDHLGRDTNLTGDQIFNGAYDNATGTAALLAIAEAYQNAEEKPVRSIAFLAVTAEERGLLGSAYYAQNPIYPVEKTVAAINMDVLNMHGRMKDITVVGYGNSELDEYVEKVAAAQGRMVNPDPAPEKGYFYRSDHFSFAKQGIPAVYADAGMEHEEFGREYAEKKEEEYRLNRYHQVSDEYDPETWDFGGAIQDLELMYQVGTDLANTKDFPNWREGNEFRALRDEQMK